MKVKKFLSILLCLVAMAGAQAQLEEYTISDIAEATDAQLPMRMSEGVILTHVSVEDGQLGITYVFTHADGEEREEMNITYNEL